MKELFSTTISLFKKNKQTWTLAILVYCLIMTIGLGVTMITGLGNLLLIIFVVCPFIFTFIKLSIKGVDNLPLDNKDIYLGYKDLSRSIFITLRKFLAPTLLCLLGYIGVYFVLSFGYIYLFEMDLVQKIVDIAMKQEAINTQEISAILLNNTELMQKLMYLNYMALGVMIILLNIFLNKKIFSIIFFMCINSTRINYDYIVSSKKELNKYKLTLYNIIISLFYIIGLTLAVLVNYLLNNIMDNAIFSYLVSSFIFLIISGIAIPFKYIAYTHLFNQYFNHEVGKLLEEEIKYRQ